MPAQLRWMALRTTVLATVVLGTAFVWTAGAMAYDAAGTSPTTAAVGESAVRDTVEALGGSGSATVGVEALVDMLPPGGATEPAPPQMMNGDNDWGSGWWIVMVVMMVGFIALVVWGDSPVHGRPEAGPKPAGHRQGAPGQG